ncbi:MAG: hypothetical protein IK062_02170 [Selenomonadaceae bacterium]|nr:hypothetical protein [Selenomonadaceae bacterium]MBR6012575.1 hypothetical protein [Selenomonadaceae bacterium]
MFGAICNFVFSGFFNFCFSISLLMLLAVAFELKKISKKRSEGDEFFQYSEKSPKLPIEKEYNDHKIGLVIVSVIAVILYLLGNGFHTPAESMKIYAQEKQEAEQKKIQEKERKEQEKIQKEERKKQEKLAEEQKEAEEEAEKERKKQEKLATEQQIKIDAENNDKNNHDFIEISAISLLNELELNAARTKKNFDEKYVKITNATITNIESDGDYINLNQSGLESIQCFPKYQSTREQIFKLNNGQVITVYGKIFHVGEVVGFSLQLLKIE